MNKFFAYLRTNTFRKNLIIAISSIAAFLLIIFFSLRFYTRHGEGMPVPKLKGLSVNEAIALLEAQGFTTVYAVINLPNDRSVALHESMGFHYFATYEKVGYKLGKWKDVGWWQLQLNEYAEAPAIPIKFSELNQQIITAALTAK